MKSPRWEGRASQIKTRRELIIFSSTTRKFPRCRAGLPHPSAGRDLGPGRGRHWGPGADPTPLRLTRLSPPQRCPITRRRWHPGWMGSTPGLLNVPIPPHQDILSTLAHPASPQGRDPPVQFTENPFLLKTPAGWYISYGCGRPQVGFFLSLRS